MSIIANIIIVTSTTRLQGLYPYPPFLQSLGDSRQAQTAKEVIQKVVAWPPKKTNERIAQTSWQTGGRMDRWMDCMDNWTDGRTDRQADRRTDWWTDRWTDGQIGEIGRIAWMGRTDRWDGWMGG